MSKIIKKTVELDEPVVIVNSSAPGILSKKGDMNWESLALTGFIKSEIESWKDKAEQQKKSRENVVRQEVDKAYQEGYDKGLTDGIQRERDNRMKSIDALLKDAKKKSRHAIRELEVKVIELAVTIAEKIILKSISADPSITEGIVAEIMSHIISSETVVLKVSSDDFKIINDKYNNWLSMAGSAAEFKIEIDKRLRTGDFIVETEGGVIDAVVPDRIDVLVEELLKVSE